MTAQDVYRALDGHASQADAEFLQSFFKTDEGQYGAGDVFIGVRVPQTRAVCKEFKDLPLSEVQALLDSEIHEHRLAALIILNGQYARGDESVTQTIYNMYLQNVYAGRINNWDLVDSSAEYIVGAHLLRRPRDILFELAKSEQLWERRVAIIACFKFIKTGDPSTTLEIAAQLRNDSEDLIQKAVGWQLREVGKRCDEQLLTNFLDQYYRHMPRTMLRYSLERLPAAKRAQYMVRK